MGYSDGMSERTARAMWPHGGPSGLTEDFVKRYAPQTKITPVWDLPKVDDGLAKALADFDKVINSKVLAAHNAGGKTSCVVAWDHRSRMPDGFYAALVNRINGDHNGPTARVYTWDVNAPRPHGEHVVIEWKRGGGR